MSEIQVQVVPPSKHNDAPMCMTQHSIMRIELTGPALIWTILGIILCIHVFQPSLTCTILALAPIPHIIWNDYLNFLNLGPGGTPSTFAGYTKLTFLRLFALSDPYTPPRKTLDINPPVGYYQRAQSWLPKRNGPRPTIAGIAPQRQIDQSGCAEMYQLLRTSLENLAIKHPDLLVTGTSCFEKKGLALFARKTINATCRGEICHVHDSDRSLHMNLHPDDCQVILEKGWGERHPLSKGGWMSRYVPQQFVMVYAPRSRMELEVVCRIIEAAAFWASGEQVHLEVESTPRVFERIAN